MNAAEKFDLLTLKLEQKFKGDTQISSAKLAIAKYLSTAPYYAAPIMELQLISDEILLNPLGQKIKMSVKTLIESDFGFFQIHSTNSEYIIQLLVDEILQQESSSDWIEDEDDDDREQGKTQFTNSSQILQQQSQINQISNQTQNQSNSFGHQQVHNITQQNSQQNQVSQSQQQQQNLQQQKLISQSPQKQQSQQSQFLEQYQLQQQQQQQKSQLQNNLLSQQQNQQWHIQQQDQISPNYVRSNRSNSQNSNKRYKFDFSITELESVSDLQNLRDFVDKNQFKALGFDIKVWNEQISIISLSVHEKGGWVQSWFIKFAGLSNIDQNETISILQSMWSNRILIVQNVASFGRALYKQFKPVIPNSILDLQVQFQLFQIQQNILGGINLLEQFPKEDGLWFSKEGKPALYGMLYCMDIIPVSQTFQKEWSLTRKNVDWMNRPLTDLQLQVLKEDVCFLGLLCDAIKKSDKGFYSEAYSRLSRAHVFWDIPLEERGGCDSQTFDRIEALKQDIEYEMRFTKITSDRYPKFVPSFTSYSSNKVFKDLQVVESFREVSSVPGQEYLDYELESVLKILPENVAGEILKYLIPSELLVGQVFNPENRQLLVNQTLLQQKNLVEIIYDDGDDGVTLRTRNDDQVSLPCKLRMSQFIKKLKQSEKLIKQQFDVQQLLSKLDKFSGNENNGDVDAQNGDDVCKLKPDSEGGHPPFRADNRLGIPGTLHRVSVIFGPTGHDVAGIIYRIGRHLPGAALPFMDLLSQIAEFQMRNKKVQGSQQEVDDKAPTPSILVMGQPGVGKTTLLRDIAFQLSEVFGLGKAVVVVDSSMEMGGEGRIPHSCLGKARRVAVANRSQQYVELRNVVQNQNPRVIIVDEIRDQNEVKTIRDISQRGVVMIATIHCPDLGALLTNSVLKDLVGGVKPVTLGDKEARHTNEGIKTRLERAGAPVFQALIEVQSGNHWKVHPNVAVSVDNTLCHSALQTQLRRFSTEQQKIMLQLNGENKEEEPSSKTGNWLQDLVALNRSLNLN